MQVQRINSQIRLTNKNNQPSFGYNLKGIESFVQQHMNVITAEELNELKTLAADEATKHINIHVKPISKDIWLANVREAGLSSDSHLIGVSSEEYPLARMHFEAEKDPYCYENMLMTPVLYSARPKLIITAILHAAKNSEIVQFCEKVLKPSHESNTKLLSEFDKLKNLFKDKALMKKAKGRMGYEYLYDKTSFATKYSFTLDEFKNSIMSHKKKFDNKQWNGEDFCIDNYAENLSSLIKRGFHFSVRGNSVNDYKPVLLVGNRGVLDFGKLGDSAIGGGFKLSLTPIQFNNVLDF